MRLRVQLVIAFLCLALFVYFALLARTAVTLIRAGTAESVALGIGVLALPLVGLWAVLATLRAGFAHDRLSRLAAEEGMELDVDSLPRMPSGRIEREAADALFATTRAELESDPDNWRRWYRLARAYDYAGDRRRARETMRTAVRLQEGKGR